MQEVVGNLAHAAADDVHAIAVYIESTMGPLTGDVKRAPAPLSAARLERRSRTWRGSSRRRHGGGSASGNAALAQLGATVYADACAACHDLGRADSSSGALRLPLAVAVLRCPTRAA